jgi:2-polyprenyl-6-methoxyphenol hydroxylase-like FAD-dependent oxidoreductase
MIGDAAHLASPRTAVGAHTAVLDAMDLRQAFSRAIAEGSEDVIASGLAMYSRSGVQRARDLHRRSLEIGKQFLPRGGLGAVVSPWQLLDQSREELR